MMGIHEYLIKDRYPNLSLLADKFNVSGKTIQRDIGFLKEIHNLPIEYDKDYRGYRYTEEVLDMPIMKLTRQEVFALLLARKSIEQYQGTAFENPLRSFFRKTLDHLSPLDLSSIEGVNEYVAYLPNGINTCSYVMQIDGAYSSTIRFDKPWGQLVPVRRGRIEGQDSVLPLGPHDLGEKLGKELRKKKELFDREITLEILRHIHWRRDEKSRSPIRRILLALRKGKAMEQIPEDKGSQGRRG
jgi:hypothetical protein